MIEKQLQEPIETIRARNELFGELEQQAKDQYFDLSDSSIKEGDDASSGLNLMDMGENTGLWDTLTEHNQLNYQQMAGPATQTAHSQPPQHSATTTTQLQPARVSLPLQSCPVRPPPPSVKRIRMLERENKKSK